MKRALGGALFVTPTLVLCWFFPQLWISLFFIGAVLAGVLTMAVGIMLIAGDL
jgi:hypothetical protein